jgi:serine/threonine-protein kinase
VAIVAVIAAIALSHSDDQGSSRAPSTSAAPSALPNTGPFTGTFTVDFGPQLSAAGNPQGGRPYKETWHLRSACGANGCIATATNDNDPLEARIFDYVDGRWLSVANKPAKCKIHDGEEWNIVSVAPQPNGTLSGEFVIANSMECYATASVMFTRTADTDIALLPDPANQPPRVVSPAEALHGSYHSTATFSYNSRKYEADFAVHTYCMRTGQRCISYFRNSAEGGEADPLVFGNGTWLLVKDHLTSDILLSTRV